MNLCCLGNIFGAGTIHKHEQPHIQFELCNSEDETENKYSEDQLLSTIQTYAKSVLNTRTTHSTPWNSDSTCATIAPKPQSTGVIIALTDRQVTMIALCSGDDVKAGFVLKENLISKKEQVTVDIQSYVDRVPLDRTTYHRSVFQVKSYTFTTNTSNPDKLALKIIATLLKLLQKNL